MGSELIGGLIFLGAGIAGLFGTLKVLWGNPLNKFLGALILLIPFSVFLLMPIFGLYETIKRRKKEANPNTREETKADTKNSSRKKKMSELSETLQRVIEKEKGWGAKLDEMNGYQFERFVAQLFEEMGYSTRVTKPSKDQGVDVIAKTPFETLAIQAKNYQGKVSNSAVQEIVAAKNPSKADKAIVVVTSSFTKSAKNLAEANNVKLVDREELMNMIDEYM